MKRLDHLIWRTLPVVRTLYVCNCQAIADVVAWLDDLDLLRRVGMDTLRDELAAANVQQIVDTGVAADGHGDLVRVVKLSGDGVFHFRYP